MGNVNFIIVFLLVIVFLFALLQYFEIKRLKDKLRLMERVQNDLYSVAEKITKANTEDEVYSLILDAAIDLIPYASKGSILIFGDDDMLYYRSVKGFSEDLKKLSLRREEAFLHNINNFSQTFIIKNPNKLDEDIITPEKIEEMKKYEALDIYCTMSSPIYIDEKLIGIMNVDSTSKDKTFTREDVDLINYIKNELQLALKNSFIQNKLKYMANFDELTGLFNRRHFKQFLNKELKRIKRYGHEDCLALIDLDDFKTINDTYGHNMGDKALKLFAEVLRHNIRKSDVYARMSGDEFVILFVNCSKADAVERLESVREMLKEKKVDGITVSFSYGLCEIDVNSSLNQDDIFGFADREMYSDKKTKEIR
jgi:diguanylate cyclase (GGDEF)-like protein